MHPRGIRVNPDQERLCTAAATGLSPLVSSSVWCPVPGFLISPTAWSPRLARRRSGSSAIFPCPPAITTRMPPPYLPGSPVSEQMAQQVDVALRPGLLPDRLHHHGTGIFLPGDPQRGVIVDPHPGAAVRDPGPPVPGIQPVVVSEQDDKGHPAGTRELSHLRQQPGRQAP